MKTETIFTPSEKRIRDFILNQPSAVGLQEILDHLEKPESNHWRVDIARQMRTVCLKSRLEGPEIIRASRLGRGGKALYKAK